MGKSWTKGLKKAKSEALKIPREIDAIRAEYTDLCAKLGDAKYKVSFNQQVIDVLLERLKDLDQEASARTQLNASATTAVANAPAEQTEPVSGAV